MGRTPGLRRQTAGLGLVSSYVTHIDVLIAERVTATISACRAPELSRDQFSQGDRRAGSLVARYRRSPASTHWAQGGTIRDPAGVTASRPGVVVTQALASVGPPSTLSSVLAGTRTTSPGPASTVAPSRVTWSTPARTNTTSSRLGRWATPSKPAGTSRRHAHSWSLPRDGAT